MKKHIIILIAISFSHIVSAQNFMTREGVITFYSHTALEDITASNNEVGSIINSESGEVVITLSMKDFEFEKKLMEEHFNENYVESEKFPKATFKGYIINNGDVDYNKKGVYKVKVEGEMEIHGQKNKVAADGTVEVSKNSIIAKTEFMLNPEDYGIKIPNLVRKNIAENMEIRVDMEYKPM